jgi:hypothetical protein
LMFCQEEYGKNGGGPLPQPARVLIFRRGRYVVLYRPSALHH